MDIPFYRQKDGRWKDTFYPEDGRLQTIGSGGSAPCCGAMAVSALTGRPFFPSQAARFAARYGKSGWELFPALAQKYRLDYCETYSVDFAASWAARGGLCVCALSSSFGGSRRFLLLTKASEKGVFLMDPDFSAARYRRMPNAALQRNRIFLPKEQAKAFILCYFCFGKSKGLPC